MLKWWDEEVQELVEDGFLNPRDWEGSTIEYCKELGLINNKKEDDKPEIIGYFICRLDEGEEVNPSNIFVAIDEVFDSEGNITCYAPIGQHGVLSREYLTECQPISKEEYIRISKQFYTPEDYL